MAKFRQKSFTLIPNTLRGAGLGAIIGGVGVKLLGKTLPNKVPLFNDRYSKGNSASKRLLLVAGTTLVGAALGALVGTLGKTDQVIARHVGSRLADNVVQNLKKNSFKEGQDFTRDPKTSTEIRTKVCIVITKDSGDLKLLINTQSDPKLKELTYNLTKNIKNSTAKTTNASNKFNEITLTTISDGSADAGLISGICEQYIRNGFPVYLVEVG